MHACVPPCTACAGEAGRAATALGAGYLSRPFLKIETILAPVYNVFISTFVPNATYSLPDSNNQAAYVSTLNTLGLTLAAAFFAPKLLWGWETEQCLQVVVPLCAGWFFFDVVYMGTLLYKLRQTE